MSTYPALGFELRNSDNDGKCFRVVVAGEVLVTQRLLKQQHIAGETGPIRHTCFPSPSDAVAKANAIVANRVNLEYTVGKPPLRFDVNPDAMRDITGAPLIAAYLAARSA